MRRVLLAALCACLPVVLGATVLVPIEFRELVTVSTTIVHGRVTDVHAEWIDGRRSIETVVTLGARDYLKGNLGETVSVRVPGGQIGRYRTIFIGAPALHLGDDLVLFLRGDRIVGLNQGAFRVVPDAHTGTQMVTSPIVMAAGGDAPERVVRGDSSRRPVTVDAFRDTVKQVLAAGAR
jgi:hypothetical protein